MIERRIRALVAKPGLDTDEAATLRSATSSYLGRSGLDPDEAATLRSATSSHLGPRSHPGGTRLG